MKKNSLLIFGLMAIVTTFVSFDVAASEIAALAIAKAVHVFDTTRTILFVAVGLGCLIPCFVFIYILCARSHMRPNRYGPVPEGVGDGGIHGLVFLLIFFLPILGILGVGGLAGYSKAMFKHKLNTTFDQATMLVTNIRTMYGTQESYEGLSVDQANRLGIIPNSAYQYGEMINPFGGTVDLRPADILPGVANSGFIVRYKGLPKEACIALASADWGTGEGSGYIGAAVNGTTWSAKYKGDTNEGIPYPLSRAINYCSDSSTVELKFY